MKKYFCFECKKLIPSLDQVYLVEDGQLLTYCSENCVKNFFEPFKQHFRENNEKQRRAFGILEEKGLPELEDIDTLQKILRENTRVFEMENEFGFKVTSFLSEMDYEEKTIFSLLICLMYDEKPSLILFQSYSLNQELLEKLVCGKELEEKDFEEEEEFSSSDGDPKLDKETMERMEQRKSKLLADLLQIRKETDIAFEKFNLYDRYLPQTLEEPDEIFQWEEDSEQIYSYIRSFNVEGTSFYYLVLCIHHFFDEEEEEEVLLPIIGFPSLDVDIYKIYTKGDQVLGNLKS